MFFYLDEVQSLTIRRLSDQRAVALLESIISTPAIPPPVVERAANLLIKEALSQELPEKASAARSLLSVIQQRHPDVFQRMTKAEQEEDEGLKQAIDQLTLSLSFVCVELYIKSLRLAVLTPFPISQVSTKGPQSQGKADMVVASASADTNIRVIAVKELLASLSSSSLTGADKVCYSSMVSVSPDDK